MLRGGRVVTLISVLTALAAPALGGGVAGADSPPLVERPAISGPITLASVTADGMKGNGSSARAEISSSGEVVAFDTQADNLDAGDTDRVTDVYVKNLVTGTLTLASTSDSGDKGNDDSFGASLSTEGSLVAFSSQANSLDPADPLDGIDDIYVKDLTTGGITLASTSDTGVKGNAASEEPTLSRSGDRVGFWSRSFNLDPADTDVVYDAYVKDLTTDDITLASTTRGGVKGDKDVFDPALSPSGTRLVFATASDNLNAADSDVFYDVYVKVLGSGKLILASTNDGGVKGDFNATEPSISAKGTKVAFASDSTNLDPAASGLSDQIYVKNLTTGDISLVSTSDDGVAANGLSEAPALSPDGRRVVFESFATNLDPADPDSDPDLFLKDLVTGDISLVTTSSNGVKGAEQPQADPLWPSISGKGRLVAFHTEMSNLDPGDPDDDADVFVKEPILCTTIGTPGNDVMTGTHGDDVLCGRDGIDIIDGKGGDDVLFGEDDDDILLGGPGSDRMDGGSGSDSVDYTDSEAAISIELSAGTGVGGDADGDQLAALEAVVGTPFDDTLTGDALDDFLVGGGGADVLSGGAGVDEVNYFSSPAGVTINLAKETASGGDADGDVLSKIENVAGSDLGDKLTGNGQANLLQGLDGDDTLTGKDGDDTLLGQAGIDTFDGGDGTDTCDAVAGESATECEP